jgi:hypothetical protein
MWYEYPVQLFDVQTDPAEARDLAAATPERVAQLDAICSACSPPSARGAARRARSGTGRAPAALGYLGGSAADGHGSPRRAAVSAAAGIQVDRLLAPLETLRQSCRE